MATVKEAEREEYSPELLITFGGPFNYGNDIYNATRLYSTQSRNGRRNMLAEVADRWSPTNASNKVPLYNGYITNDVYSRFVEDGSFLRLKNITLGYTLPKNGQVNSMYPDFVFMLQDKTYSVLQDIVVMIRR